MFEIIQSMLISLALINNLLVFELGLNIALILPGKDNSYFLCSIEECDLIKNVNFIIQLSLQYFDNTDNQHRRFQRDPEVDFNTIFNSAQLKHIDDL